MENMRSIAIERDLAVPMRDGARLFVNLFRPPADGRYPVIMSVTPYGKDKLPDRLTAFFMRLSGVKFGKLNCSPLTGFEAPESTLQLTIQGHDAARYPGFRHRKLVNRGWHAIFTGGPYDSCLTAPLNNRDIMLDPAPAASTAK